MAVTRGNTNSAVVSWSVTGTDASIGITVDVGATLLLVSVLTRAELDISGTPQWSVGSQNLTLVDSTTRGAAGDPMAVETWGLVNPNDGAGTVTVTLDADEETGIITFAFVYLGTVTSSVANAVSVLEEDVNDAGTTTTVFASAGTPGNALLAIGGFKGGDGNDITVPANFNELMDVESGASTGGDTSGYACDQLDGAPDSCTWTWSADDKNAAHYLEIAAAAAAGTNTIIIVPTGPPLS